MFRPDVIHQGPARADDSADISAIDTAAKVRQKMSELETFLNDYVYSGNENPQAIPVELGGTMSLVEKVLEEDHDLGVELVGELKQMLDKLHSYADRFISNFMTSALLGKATPAEYNKAQQLNEILKLVTGMYSSKDTTSSAYHEIDQSMIQIETLKFDLKMALRKYEEKPSTDASNRLAA